MTLTTPRRSNSLPIRFMDRARPDGHLLVNPAKTQPSTLQWATQFGRAEPLEDPRSRLKQSQEVPSNFPEGSATEASTPHFHQTHLFAGSVTSRSQVQLLKCWIHQKLGVLQLTCDHVSLLTALSPPCRHPQDKSRHLRRCKKFTRKNCIGDNTL